MLEDKSKNANKSLQELVKYEYSRVCDPSAQIDVSSMDEPTLIAVMTLDVNRLKTSLNSGKTLEVSQDGNSALHLIASLYANNARPNDSDILSLSRLNCVKHSLTNIKAVSQALVEAGISPSAKNAQGKTAASIAADSGDTQLAALFASLEFSVNLQAKSCSTYTPSLDACDTADKSSENTNAQENTNTNSFKNK